MCLSICCDGIVTDRFDCRQVALSNASTGEWPETFSELNVGTVARQRAIRYYVRKNERVCLTR